MHAQDVKKILVSPDTTIKEAMKAMDISTLETILVIDQNQRLIGLVSDGDIRRAFIDNVKLEDKIEKIMNKNFTAVPYTTPYEDIIKLMKKHYFKQMPIVDENRKVLDIALLKDIFVGRTHDNYVVLMAGGLGTRLKPLTNTKPKPMIEIGGKPILEITINLFKKHGFKNFIISVNYLANIVEGYFGDGSEFDVNIQYIKETKRLGTAGCLKLMPKSIDKPFFVMNGDILTRLNIEDMFKFHSANMFDVTMGVTKYKYELPYGIIGTDGNCIQNVQEKPVQTCEINAGIYCLNPDMIQHIPQNEYYDMTSLVNKCISNNNKIGAYHIEDYWMDIGQVEDYKKANTDYNQIFKTI